MFKQFRKSLYLKLLLIFFTTAILLFTLLASTTHLINKPDDIIASTPGSNLVYYGQKLVAEIGKPVNIKKAQQLAQKLDLIIQIKNPELNWQSDIHDMPDDVHLKFHHTTSNPNIQLGRYHQYFVLWIKENNTEYLFAMKHQPFADNFIIFLILLILILITVIGASYFAVRWVLKPLNWMQTGVKQIEQGNLEQQIEIRHQDELGELTEAINQMSQSLKTTLESKEQLLLDVSHELRSPITRMKLALELMQDEKLKTSVSSDLAEMENMVSELLETARLNNSNHALNKSPTDISQLAQEVVERFQNQAPGVVLEHDSEPTFLDIDVERMKIVLRNILDNALKYSSNQNKPVEIISEMTNNSFLLKIIDYGLGIPIEETEKIFDPFYRIDKSRTGKTGGYGLGLSLCKKIMQAHNGDIFVDYSIREATCITLKLPITQQKSNL